VVNNQNVMLKTISALRNVFSLGKTREI